MKAVWTTAIVVGALWLAPTAANAEVVEPLVPVRQQAENIGAIESESSSTALTRTNLDANLDAIRTVRFHGHFIDGGFPVPRGRPAPSGTELTYKINSLGQVVERELGGPEVSQWRASKQAVAARRKERAHAAATWKCHLGGAEEEHCYALSEWVMKSGESVEGAEAIVDTEQVDVYGWESGAFVDDEMWLSWNSGPNQWAEAGQTAGEYINCCTLHPFVAWKVAGQPYKIVLNQGLTYTTNQYYQYQISGQSADGHWCLYLGESQVACPYFGPEYARSTQLEDGMEVAANTWQANNGTNQVNGWWSGARRHWNFDKLYRETDTCVLRPSGAPWPGDVQYATCQEP